MSRENVGATQGFERTIPATSGRETVLVVDDDAAVGRALERVLASRGYDAVAVQDGQAAFDALLERRFDVILSDIQMPRMSGVDLLSVVRSYDLDVPVILMTGAPSIETAIEAVSLGALQYLVKPVSSDVLFKTVERASRLHRIARAKRDALKLAGAVETEAGDRAGLSARFELALETLEMAFQPIVDPARRAIFGYEALVRPSEPSMPNPATLLAAAERLGRLPELGRRIRELTAWAFARAPSDALLFINLHTLDLLDSQLFRQNAPLTAIAERVVLEVTERATIDDIPDVQARVTALRRMGFRIAIDDLGAGYAGLSSFVALEPDIVKLDISLVRGVHESPIKQSLVRTMAALCAEMGMRVIAEGVEVAPERDTARRLGCELLQGYLFARPGPAFPPLDETQL